MTTYNTDEAKRIFVRAHSRALPSAHKEDRIAAANTLYDAVVQCAKDSGLNLMSTREESGRRAHAITFPRGSGYDKAVVLELVIDRFAVTGDGAPMKPEIEYDAAEKRFVGTQNEEHVAPGERPRRRDAAAVVASAIVDMLGVKL
jgi:hypothetical protein